MALKVARWCAGSWCLAIVADAYSGGLIWSWCKLQCVLYSSHFGSNKIAFEKVFLYPSTTFFNYQIIYYTAIEISEAGSQGLLSV